MQAREVDRHPAVPELSDEAIKLVTQLCFRRDDPIEPADLIFVFSTPLEPDIVVGIITDLLNHNISKKVFISGGSSAKYGGVNGIEKPESSYVLDRIDKTDFPGVEFYSETTSANTLENVTESLKVLDFSSYEKVLYVFKSHASRRAYLTLRKFLPTAKLVQKTFSAVYPNTDIILDATTWHTYAFGRERVWGEYLRIKKYGERGDVAYDDETRMLVEKIEAIVQIGIA